MKTVRLGDAQRHLALLWGLGAGVLATLLLIQSLGDIYGRRVFEVWNWLLISVSPAGGAIVSTVVGWKKDGPSRQISRTKLKWARGVSIAYLAVLVLTIFALEAPSERLKFLPTSEAINAVLQSGVLIMLKPFLGSR